MRRSSTGRGEQVSEMLSGCQLMTKTNQTARDNEKTGKKASREVLGYVE